MAQLRGQSASFVSGTPGGVPFSHFDGVPGVGKKVAGVDDIVGLLTEVFTWVGFGGGAALLAIALIASIADGTWLPARGAVEPTPEGPVVRWFDVDGNVSEAPLSDADVRALGGAGMIDLWYRRGWLGRMRLQPHAHGVRALLGIAALLIGVGVVSTVVQLVMLAAAG